VTLPYPRPSRFARAIAVGISVFGASAPAAAQDVADFYRGKTLNLVIGSPEGSEYDGYARLIARHLGEHIAGNPKIAAINMPGTGGHVAAAHIYAQAAKDGTAIGAVLPETITAPLWFGRDKLQHDPTKLIYLGSANSESCNCFIRSDTPIQSMRDTLARDVTLGATLDRGPTWDGPALLNNLIGTRFRLVAKYRATRDIVAAIQDSEVEGVCGMSFSSMSTQRPGWIPKGVVRILVQENIKGAALATKMGAPLATEFAQSAADREIMALAYAQQAFARPYILPPGTPDDRVAMLRQAFLDTLHDPQLLAQARAARIEINAVSGADLDAAVAKLYATPAPLLERVRDSLTYKPLQ
jgi:tripartite-type tricarboxylate transporter receptor subunit TctC